MYRALFVHTNSPRTARGIALLEMAVLSVVVLPVLLALGVLTWYYYEVSLIRSALSQSLHDVSVKTLRVSMGRMDGWLRTRQGPLEQEFPHIADDIRTRVAEQLGTDPDVVSGTKYQIDIAIGYGSFRVDTHGGYIFEPARRQGQAWIETYPPHSINGLAYPEVSDTMNAATLTYTALRRLAPEVIPPYDPETTKPEDVRFYPPTSYDPSPFAIPSGQYGTRLQLHFGPSHAYGGATTHADNRSWRPVNDYLRTTLVLGAAIVVDFSASTMGKLVSGVTDYTKFWETNEPGGIQLPTRIVHVEVMSPRNDF